MSLIIIWGTDITVQFFFSGCCHRDVCKWQNTVGWSVHLTMCGHGDIQSSGLTTVGFIIPSYCGCCWGKRDTLLSLYKTILSTSSRETHIAFYYGTLNTFLRTVGFLFPKTTIHQIGEGPNEQNQQRWRNLVATKLLKCRALILRLVLSVKCCDCCLVAGLYYKNFTRNMWPLMVLPRNPQILYSPERYGLSCTWNVIVTCWWPERLPGGGFLLSRDRSRPGRGS